MRHCRCILIRHGKTPGNERGVYIGKRTDESLSETGQAEALSCKDDYKELLQGDAGFFSSPMSRCKETMALLYDVTKPVIIDELAEMDFGLFEGKNYEELSGSKGYQEWIDSNGELPFPDGEDKRQFTNRTIKGFNKMINISSRDNMVLVCHGGTIMAVMSHVAGGEYYDYQVKNLKGYDVSFDYEDGRIFNVTYCSI